LDISTKICGVKLQNPTVLASGIMGMTGASLCFTARKGAGAVTTKSIGIEERKGHPAPIVIEWDKGLINAVGLSAPGIEESMEELGYAVQNSQAPVIASIFAPTTKKFGETAKIVSKAKPSLIEVNISCPNVDKGGLVFGVDPEISARVTETVVKNTDKPVIVKLTPNVTDITVLAKAIEEAGATGLSLINTLTGMAVDINTKRPIITFFF